MNAAVSGIIICIFLNYARASGWGYGGENGPSSWSEDAKDCGGLYQSPVDIVTRNSLIDPNLHLFKFHGYEQSLTGDVFVNNGHSVQLNFKRENITISGGGFESTTYRALQLHFHWAPPGSNAGSEHTIDGKQYPVEMHIVHMKEPYTSTEDVKHMRDGLAVLGILFEIGPNINEPFQKLLNTAQECSFAGSEATVEDGPTLLDLFPESESYYRYYGSLTTPPCYETVAWTIFSEPVAISESQLHMLQSLKTTPSDGAAKRKARDVSSNSDSEDHSLGGNFRPVQPVDGRVVTSFVDYKYKKLEEHDWSYYGSMTGSEKWSKSYPSCGKSAQSPINIDSSSADSTKVIENLDFNNYEAKLEGNFINNGHAVQLNFDKSLNYSVTGGGLRSHYTAQQLHFHWGEALPNGDINEGSEHMLNNISYPAEMHIVHVKTSEMNDVESYRESAGDAYLVLGVFIQVYKDDSAMDNNVGANEDMQALIDAISHVTYADDTAPLHAGPSLSSILPKSKSFFRYNGSLTTPPCSESVVWTVFDEPIEISFNQFVTLERLFLSKKTDVSERQSISKMKKIPKEAADGQGSDEGHLISKRATNENGSESALLQGTANHLLRNNYRPIQSLNSRAIYYHVTSEPSAGGLPVVAIVLSVLGGIAAFIFMAFLAKRCLCDKDGKKASTKYTAGQKADDDGANI